MPDITMCTNNGCPLKDRCYRFMAEPKEPWQSFCQFHPVIDQYLEASCDMFVQQPAALINKVTKQELQHLLVDFSQETHIEYERMQRRNKLNGKTS